MGSKRMRIRTTVLTAAIVATAISAGAGSVTAQAEAEAETITDEMADLAAGTWVDATSGAAIEFTVEDGWYVDGAPIEEVGVALAHSDIEGAYLALTQFEGNVWTEPCATASSDETFWEESASVDASAQGFADHLEAHPYVTVSEVTPVEISGFSGLQVDMRSNVPAECEPTWAWLWQLPVVADFHLADAEDARFIALDVGDHVAVIAAEAYTGSDPENPQVDWVGFLELLSAMTDSMAITPAEG